MRISVPNDVEFIINKLESCGYDAYIVGGCVRDLILNHTPNDWDITTSANPEIIKSVFDEYRIINTGEKHGTIGVVINGNIYEITTYRIDGEYEDSRHPDSVEFTDDIIKDLARRDFTINAIAYNKKIGFVDPFNGIKDIELNAVRCVGDPEKRFTEDSLRILRALRFASVYNFNIEVNTANALMKKKDLLKNIAVERIAVEFNKILCGVNVSYILRRYKDIFAVFIPEIVSTFNCNQNTPHHNKNVWKHTTSAVANIRNNLELRMVMFMHDIGKPISKKTDKKGVDHFKNHQRYSAELTKIILERLKYPNLFIENVVLLVLHHDERDFENKTELKKFLNKLSVEKFELLLEIRKADILAQSNYQREKKLVNLDQNIKMFNEIISKNECFTLKQLEINGSDLIHLGITKGTDIGYILNSLLDDVISGNVENNNLDLKERVLSVYRTSLNK